MNREPAAKTGLFGLRLNAQGVRRVGVFLGVILLVALPRLTHLNGYLIVDEADRWRWAEQFYRALIAGDLRATLVGDGYPGIVPVWLETIWLLGESARQSLTLGRWFGEEGVYLLFHVWGRTEYLAQQRLPIVLFNSLLTLLVGWYTGRVYGRRVGLVAVILIALNPFYLADSRVNRAEAVITGLLTLSILFLVRYKQTRQRGWLIASGFVGGLSFLTKIQGVAVLPAIAAILVFFHLGGERAEGAGGRDSLLSRLVLAMRDGAWWALTAVLTWTLFWPAMWVRPFDVVSLVFNYTTRKAGSEGVNLFFLGKHFYDQDPGPAFYPVVALMRITPLTMLGLALAAWGAIRSLRSQSVWADGSRWAAAAPLLIYVLLYAGAMTIGSHKQDRYLMPVFLGFDILAAIGWVYLWEQLCGRWHKLRTGYSTTVALAGLLLVQMVSVLPYHPYYFPFFNPLLGGGRVGAKTLRVGWGEGMDLVADYLNAKPNAASLTVAARWNQYMFDFAGRVLPFDETGRWTQADYVVLYIQQTQRMLDPSPGIIRYFQARQAEHIVTINGIEYAQIYRSPFTRPAQPQVSVVPGKATLFGYRWEAPRLPESGMPSSAGIGQLTVIWENQRLNQPARLAAALTDGDGKIDWHTCQTAAGFEAAAITPGEVVESGCDLSAVAAKLSAGAFDLRVGLADRDGNVIAFPFPQGWRSLIKEEDGAWRPAEWLESLDQIARHQVPSSAELADIYYRGQIRLVAYQLSATALQPGQPLNITLYWQALAPVEEDYTIFNHLFGLDGVIISQSDEVPAVPSSRWLPGQVIATTHSLLTDPILATPAVATLDVGLYDAQHNALPVTDRHGQRMPVTLTRLKFVPRSWSAQSPPILEEAVFEEGLVLEGHSILPAVINPKASRPLTLQLWWQTLATPDRDYSVFVHLLDTAGNIVAQGDGVPVAGRYPTSAWEPGERIIDSRIISLPSDLAAGEYRLIVGLYNPVDGGRLRPVGGDVDFVLLGQIVVSPQVPE